MIAAGFAHDGYRYGMADIAAATAAAGRPVKDLPFAVRVLLENILRQRLAGDSAELQRATRTCIGFEDGADSAIPLAIPRVILPDSSGVPVLQDIASLRDAVAAWGGNPERIETVVPVDLVIDHSLVVDFNASRDAPAKNLELELRRNAERYRFLKWAESAFESLRVFPPGTGIIHQVNLEHISQVVMVDRRGSVQLAHPDMVIGGDSHTTMINGIGVLGWGVGGVDATGVMLGEPYTFAMPQIVGVELRGRMGPGLMTTDLALAVTERLRHEKVTAAIVEFFGDGVSALSVPERATIANMAPEYGASGGYFAVDARTLDYLRQSRGAAHADFVGAYCRANSLFRTSQTAAPAYVRRLAIELGDITPAVAGPSRPQDRLPLDRVAKDFRDRLNRPVTEGGFGRAGRSAAGARLEHGSVIVASITSCTNTSNPMVLLAAGLLAQKAVARGLKVPDHVRTSFAPGSRAVPRYLAEAGLMAPLEALGFHVVGYGCTVCAGKSGPLAEGLAEHIDAGELVVATVLSGNRNFAGRIHRQARANYIMSPPLVVAYALTGRVDIDLTRDVLGKDATGQPVRLADLWPSESEIAACMPFAEGAGMLQETYAARADSDEVWSRLEAPQGPLFPWDAGSQYLMPSRFFGPPPGADRAGLTEIEGARILAMFGDSLTTDHVSPSGEIPTDGPAGRYLADHGVSQGDFNLFVTRRGNPEVMARGTFANVRIVNLLVPEREGGWTRHFPDGEVMRIFDAAARYRQEGTPLIVVAGAEYGTGSSRDWAAKGPWMLGVRAVLAGSFERIHRSNLIAMGIVPLRLEEGDGCAAGLDGDERIDLPDLTEAVREGRAAEITATKPAGARLSLRAMPDVLTDSERSLLLAGGLFAQLLKQRLAAVGAAGA